MKSTDLIKAARAKIQLGWLQGAYHLFGMPFEPDRYCILGALRAAAQELAAHDNTLQAAKGRIALEIRRRRGEGTNCLSGSTIVGFNDHRDTTQEKVLQLLDAAGEGK